MPQEPNRNRNLWKVQALRTVLIYMVVSAIWIAFSDRLLAVLFTNIQEITLFATIKGMFFVLATGIMLYSLIQRDLRNIKQSETALKQSEERLARIVETTPNGIVITNLEGTITLVNGAAEEVLGYDRKDLLDHSAREVLGMRSKFPDGSDISWEHSLTYLVLERGQSLRLVEYLYYRPDGKIINVLMNSSPLRDDSGATIGQASALTDVTERRRIEQERLEVEQHKREFYRRTILAATEGKLEISDSENIRRLAGPAIAEWNIVHGEDLGVIRLQVTEIAEELHMDEPRIYDFILAVGEATTNSYKHAGNGHVSLHQADDSLMVVVADHGPGMEALTLPEVALTKGYSTTGTLGMGYKAILSVADKVYLATGSSGTTVAILMSLHPKKMELASAGLPDTWA